MRCFFGRLKFAAKSEAFNAEQKSLLDETIDADMEALQRELDALVPPPPKTTTRSKSPSASRYRATCRAGRSATSPRPPLAPAAAS